MGLFKRKKTIRLERYRAMDDEAMNDALEAAPGLPLWEALHQLLDEHIQEFMNDSLTEAREGKSSDFSLGAVEGLVMLKQSLLDRAGDARKIQEERIRRMAEEKKQEEEQRRRQEEERLQKENENS